MSPKHNWRVVKTGHIWVQERAGRLFRCVFYQKFPKLVEGEPARFRVYETTDDPTPVAIGHARSLGEADFIVDSLFPMAGFCATVVSGRYADRVEVFLSKRVWRVPEGKKRAVKVDERVETMRVETDHWRALRQAFESAGCQIEIREERRTT